MVSRGTVQKKKNNHIHILLSVSVKLEKQVEPKSRQVHNIHSVTTQKPTLHIITAM